MPPIPAHEGATPAELEPVEPDELDESIEPSSPRRSPWIWIVSGAVALVAVIVIAMTAGGGTTEQPPAEPARGVPVALPPPSASPDAQPADAASPDSSIEEVGSGSASAAGSGSAKPIQKPIVPVKPVIKKPSDPAKKKWDPNALFPK